MYKLFLEEDLKGRDSDDKVIQGDKQTETSKSNGSFRGKREGDANGNKHQFRHSCFQGREKRKTALLR